MLKMFSNEYFYKTKRNFVQNSSRKYFTSPNRKFTRIQQKNSHFPSSPFKIVRHFTPTPAKILRRRSSSTENFTDGFDQKSKAAAMKIVSKYKVRKFIKSTPTPFVQRNTPLIRLGNYKMVTKRKTPTNLSPYKLITNQNLSKNIKKTPTNYFRNFNLSSSSSSSMLKFNKRPSFIVRNKFILNRKPKTPVQTQANKVLQRSVEILSSKKSKSKFLRCRSVKAYTKRQLCPVFISSGRCPKGERCRFLHDSEKVSVCKKFLRGICVSETCHFSHDVSPDKMPLCRFFLQGACGRTNCPYLHVKHSDNAEICDKFRTGYCPNGAKCTNLHVERTVVDSFRFLNGKRTKTKPKSSNLCSIKGKMPKNTSMTPKSLNEPLPSFISLTPNVADSSCEHFDAVDLSKIQIIPSFLNF